MKKLLAVISVLFAVYISFVTFDCIRLKTAPTGTKPIVTVNETEKENRVKYMGLGYSVNYYTDSIPDEKGNETKNIYGAEFMFFDRVLIWGWVE